MDFRRRGDLTGRKRLVSAGEVGGLKESLAKLAEARNAQIEGWVKRAPFTGETHALVCFVDYWVNAGRKGHEVYREFVFAVPHAEDRALRGRAVGPELLAELKARFPFLEVTASAAVTTERARPT